MQLHPYTIIESKCHAPESVGCKRATPYPGSWYHQTSIPTPMQVRQNKGINNVIIGNNGAQLGPIERSTHDYKTCYVVGEHCTRYKCEAQGSCIRDYLAQFVCTSIILGIALFSELETSESFLTRSIYQRRNSLECDGMSDNHVPRGQDSIIHERRNSKP